jgi:response regulator RpfG family c-di-GMP phosphodiesterase
MRLAPLAGITAAIFAAAALLACALAPTWGAVIGLSLAAIIGLGVGAGTWKMGRLIRRSEHRSALLAQSARDITTLSTFPVANPDPVLKVDRRARVLYINPAGKRILEELDVSIDDIEPWLGEGWREWLAGAIDGEGPHPAREVTIEDRTFRLDISRFAHEPAALIAAHEITRLKQLEADLRSANRKLEQNVLVKTFDLLLTQDVTIMSLVSLAETRDVETGSHIHRTRQYVRLLAEQLADHPDFRDHLDDETIHALYRSAPLHDIGKVGIPDRILLKDGKLDEAAFEEMKKHTTLGGDALRWAEQRLGSNSFLQIARDIAYSHHEKWDGTGYPAGLAGEDIPLAARLMALADVYDALRSRRRYKSAYPHEEARRHVVSQRGKHFDPRIVDAFLAVEDQFRTIADQGDRQPPAGRYVTETAQASEPAT